jgi:hypothetical protein
MLKAMGYKSLWIVAWAGGADISDLSPLTSALD